MSISILEVAPHNGGSHITTDSIEQRDSGRSQPIPSMTAAEAHLAECCTRQLQQTRYAGLRRVDVDVRGGTVRLQGCVSSFHLKQLAQSIVQQVPGIRKVLNELEVRPGE
ncbi:MAG: BON domain-containing protein [Planctomycetes bacterium]|nr:BON domain-containing protein [Planctomycetota bacterium]